MKVENIKLLPCVIKHTTTVYPCAYTQRMYEGMELHTFLTLLQSGVEYLVACPCHLTYSLKTSKSCSYIINLIYFVLFIFCFINSII